MDKSEKWLIALDEMESVSSHTIELTFSEVYFAVSCNGLVVLVVGPLGLVELMDGCIFEDNCQIKTTERFSELDPGFYRCTIHYWFDQGYFEGWEADGESEWDFEPVDIQRIEVK